MRAGQAQAAVDRLRERRNLNPTFFELPSEILYIGFREFIRAALVHILAEQPTVGFPQLLLGQLLTDKPFRQCL